MTIQEVMDKAVTGGYHINGSDGMQTYYSGASRDYSAWTRKDNNSSFMVAVEETFLDPVFWQALGGCPRISVIGSLNPGWPIDYTPGWGTALDITLSLQGHGGSSASRRSAPGHLKPIDEAPYGLDRAQTTPIAPNLEQIMR